MHAKPHPSGRFRWCAPRRGPLEALFGWHDRRHCWDSSPGWCLGGRGLDKLWKRFLITAQDLVPSSGPCVVLCVLYRPPMAPMLTATTSCIASHRCGVSSAPKLQPPAARHVTTAPRSPAQVTRCAAMYDIAITCAYENALQQVSHLVTFPSPTPRPKRGQRAWMLAGAQAWPLQWGCRTKTRSPRCDVKILLRRARDFFVASSRAG